MNNGEKNHSDKPQKRIFSRADLPRVRKLVVKVGSALLLADNNGAFDRIASQIIALTEEGLEVILVSSGAVALGLQALGYESRPKDRAIVKAAAAIGQSAMMSLWRKSFAAHSIQVGQLLLTHSDLKDRSRYMNLRKILAALSVKNVIPIINENDVISVESIKIGNNDALAAEVAGVTLADALCILTSTNGLFSDDPTTNPEATRVSCLYDIESLDSISVGRVSAYGTGGARTKLDAAKNARLHGVATIVASGYDPAVLHRVLSGEDIGTLIVAPQKTLTGKKRWIATTLRSGGTVMVDAGAVRAIQKNASLLYAGVTKVQGTFGAGDLVNICSVDGNVIARGIASVGSAEATNLAGKKSKQARLLNRDVPDELVHRDSMVILNSNEA